MTKQTRSLKGKRVRILRRVENNAGDVLHVGDIVVVKKHHQRAAAVDLHRPAVSVNCVGLGIIQVVSDDE